jgi:hypothetical protein
MYTGGIILQTNVGKNDMASSFSARLVGQLGWTNDAPQKVSPNNIR